MHYQATRVLARNVHILVAVFQFIYVYSPLHAWPHAISIVQWVTFPLLLITGIWLRKGQVLWFMLQSRTPRHSA